MKDQDWDIKARSDVCSHCDREYEDKEAFYSKLTFGEEGYNRADFCENCWTDGAQSDALSKWRTVYRAPAPPPDPALKKETAESLLRDLIQTDRTEKGNTIYILAVMLERRRIFVERDVQERDDGALIRVYEHRKSGEVFLIPDPRLKLAEIEEVQVEVIEMLDGKPAGETEEQAEPAEPAPASDPGDPENQESQPDATS